MPKRLELDPYLTLEFVEFTKDKPCLRVSEVAQFLRTENRSVRKWIERGELHALKVQGVVIVPRSALWEFLKRHTKET
jgi:excisionase family DNA binding protein